MAEIGKRVASARAYRGVSQTALARRIGCSVKTLNWIETGRTQGPDARLIGKIARELRVSADFLLGLSDTLREPEARPASTARVAATNRAGSRDLLHEKAVGV